MPQTRLACLVVLLFFRNVIYHIPMPARLHQLEKNYRISREHRLQHPFGSQIFWLARYLQSLRSQEQEQSFHSSYYESVGDPHQKFFSLAVRHCTDHPVPRLHVLSAAANASKTQHQVQVGPAPSQVCHLRPQRALGPYQCRCSPEGRKARGRSSLLSRTRALLHRDARLPAATGLSSP